MKTRKQQLDASRKKVEGYDRVTISGYCLTDGRFYYGLRGCIGAACSDDQVKLWPDTSDAPEKAWFSKKWARISITKKWWVYL